MRGAFRRAGVPLTFYYLVTVALPLANGASGSAFLSHALVVLALPPALIFLLAVTRAAVFQAFHHLGRRSSTNLSGCRVP